MSPSDKKEYRLVTPKMRLHLRHTVTTPHFTLPKPYRRRGAPPEDPPRSRRKLVFFGISGLVIVVLVLQIADLARESRRERALPIVAAGTGAPAAGAAPMAAAHATPAAEMAPGSPAPSHSLNEPAPVADAAGAAPASGTAAEPATAAAMPALPPAASFTGPKSAAAAPAALPRKSRPPLPAPAAPAAIPDPDVVLFTAILTLAPLILGEETAPEPACSGVEPHDAACAELQGMVP